MRGTLAILCSVVLATAAAAQIVVNGGEDQSFVSLGPVSLAATVTGGAPLDFWMADGDGPTEDHLLKYSSVSGLTAVGPLRSTAGTIYGYPGDLVRVANGTIFGWDITLRLPYRLNADTGICTSVGAKTSLQRVGAMAYDPTRNRLYAIDAASRRLMIINQATGARSNLLTLATTIANVRGMAYDSAADRLRIYNDSNESFYTINPIAKTVTVEFSVPDGTAAFYDELSDLNGRIYGSYCYLDGTIWNAQLREINFATREIRNIGAPLVQLSAHSLIVNSVPEDSLWTLDSGPGAAAFGDARSLATTAAFSVAGDYVLRLTVYSNPPVSDTVLIQVGQPDCNQNQVADSIDIAVGTSQDCDSDGVPDECQVDSDGDGVTDACDQCPNDPLKTTPGACGCGVADTDTDGDGTSDCDDLCPNDPQKIAPGACGCGVPDDADGDGQPDC
ncbi:MAG: hypothetical protein U1D55_09395 [Phycisphaerae bacterium]